MGTKMQNDGYLGLLLHFYDSLATNPTTKLVEWFLIKYRAFAATLWCGYACSGRSRSPLKAECKQQLVSVLSA